MVCSSSSSGATSELQSSSVHSLRTETTETVKAVDVGSKRGGATAEWEGFQRLGQGFCLVQNQGFC